jgi:hypothetical protein
LTLQSDGKVVVAAWVDSRGIDVVRYNRDGTRDATFGDGGYAHAELLGFFGEAVAIHTDGSILVGGVESGYSAVARLWRDDAPATTLSRPALTRPGTNPYRFQVTWRDDDAVDVSSLDNSDLRVLAPDGSTLRAYLVSLDHYTNGALRTATYHVPPRGGAWEPGDNGVYTVQLVSNRVADVEGNLAPGRVLGAFHVRISGSSPAARPFSGTSLFGANAIGVDADPDDGRADDEPLRFL